MLSYSLSAHWDLIFRPEDFFGVFYTLLQAIGWCIWAFLPQKSLMLSCFSVVHIRLHFKNYSQFLPVKIAIFFHNIKITK
jgi:hypothetical protein